MDLCDVLFGVPGFEDPDGFDGDARQLEQRRNHIGGEREGGAPAPARDPARRADDEGHPHTALGRAALVVAQVHRAELGPLRPVAGERTGPAQALDRPVGIALVVPAHRPRRELGLGRVGAVVGHEHHDRVGQVSRGVERRQHAADLPVHVLGHRGVGGHASALPPLPCFRQGVPGGHVGITPPLGHVGADHPELLHPGVTRRPQRIPAHIVGVGVLLQDIRRRVMGPVHRLKGQHREEGLPGGLRRQRRQELIDEQRAREASRALDRLAVAREGRLREDRRRPRVAPVVARPAQQREAALEPAGRRPVFGLHPEVPLAREGREVARRPQSLRQRAGA